MDDLRWSARFFFFVALQPLAFAVVSLGLEVVEDPARPWAADLPGFVGMFYIFLGILGLPVWLGVYVLAERLARARSLPVRAAIWWAAAVVPLTAVGLIGGAAWLAWLPRFFVRAAVSGLIAAAPFFAWCEVVPWIDSREAPPGRDLSVARLVSHPAVAVPIALAATAAFFAICVAVSGG